MISVLKNKNDLIYAYAEWNVVDEQGQFCENGNNIYIADLWIHPSYRRRVLKKLIFEVARHRLGLDCIYVYWNNGKKDKVKGRYLISRFLKGG